MRRRTKHLVNRPPVGNSDLYPPRGFDEVSFNNPSA
jgi:hypothetical protein